MSGILALLCPALLCPALPFALPAALVLHWLIIASPLLACITSPCLQFAYSSSGYWLDLSQCTILTDPHLILLCPALPADS